MGWEQRARGGLYYTRSHKTRGKVIREYVGTGPAAQLAARADQESRQLRAELTESWRREREALEQLDRAITDLSDQTEDATRAALFASGYRRHRRGEWRKKRG